MKTAATFSFHRKPRSNRLSTWSGCLLRCWNVASRSMIKRFGVLLVIETAALAWLAFLPLFSFPNSTPWTIGSHLDFSPPSVDNAAANNGGNLEAALTKTTYYDWSPPSECPPQMLSPTFLNHNTTTNATYSFPARNSHTDFAIITISMGKRFQDMSPFVQSIRRRGGWNGKIIIITNQENVVEDWAETESVAVLFVEERDINRELRESMPYKRFKTQLIDVLDNDDKSFSHIEYSVYIDADVLIGDPLPPFFDHVVEKFQKSPQQYQPQETSSGESTTVPKSTMLMFEDRGIHEARQIYKNKKIFHSGIIALHRRSSKKCLQNWQVIFDDVSKKWRQDQTALAYLIHVHNSTQETCQVQELDKNYYFFMETDKMTKGESGVFVHVTTGRIIFTNKEIRKTYLKCRLLVD